MAIFGNNGIPFFAFLWFTTIGDWSAKLAPLSQPIEGNRFPAALYRRLQCVFVSNSDWLIASFSSVVIGHSKLLLLSFWFYDTQLKLALRFKSARIRFESVICSNLSFKFQSEAYSEHYIGFGGAIYHFF